MHVLLKKTEQLHSNTNDNNNDDDDDNNNNNSNNNNNNNNNNNKNNNNKLPYSIIFTTFTCCQGETHGQILNQ